MKQPNKSPVMTLCHVQIRRNYIIICISSCKNYLIYTEFKGLKKLPKKSIKTETKNFHCVILSDFSFLSSISLYSSTLANYTYSTSNINERHTCSSLSTRNTCSQRVNTSRNFSFLKHIQCLWTAAASAGDRTNYLESKQFLMKQDAQTKN